MITKFGAPTKAEKVTTAQVREAMVKKSEDKSESKLPSQEAPK